MALRNRVINNPTNLEPFWDAYEALNDVNIPSPNEIQTYQLNKIKAFEESAGKNNNNKFQAINQLFLSGEVNTLEGYNEENKMGHIGKAILQVVSLIGEFRDLTKYSLQKDNELRYEQAQAKLIELHSFLTNFKSQIGVNSMVYDTDLAALESLIHHNSLRSFNQAEMKRWIDNLNRIQGELVEEMGVAFYAKKIPQDLELTAVSSGKLFYQGGAFGGKGALVQDMMVLDTSAAKDLSIEVSYKIDGKTYTRTLEQFLDMIQNSTETKQISIDDSLYEVLLDLSVLNIQAKSGINQKPWNIESGRTAFSISEYIDEAKGSVGLGVKRTFQLLQSLQSEPHPNNSAWLESSHNDYDALANYGLATVLYKVLHLSEHGNQYLLTPSGFIKYSTRVQQLFSTKNSMIKLTQSIIIDDDLLSKNRKATIGEGIAE